MVESALQKRRAQYSDARSYIQKHSQILIKEAFFRYKMCHNFKSIKAIKKIFRTYVDLSLLKICAKFLGKVTREKQVRGKKKHLSINKLSFDSFSFKFHHLCLCFEARFH